MRTAESQAQGLLETNVVYNPTLPMEMNDLVHRYLSLDDSGKTLVAESWFIKTHYQKIDQRDAFAEALRGVFGEKEDKERRKRLFSDLEETMRYGWKESGRGNVLIAFYDPVADTVRTKEVTVKNRFHDIDAVDDAVRVVLG